MHKVKLIETQEALAAFDNLYNDDPLELQKFLSYKTTENLINHLESKARISINAKNQAIEQGIDPSTAYEIGNRYLQASSQTESNYSEKELAKIAIFKVKFLKGV